MHKRGHEDNVVLQGNGLLHTSSLGELKKLYKRYDNIEMFNGEEAQIMDSINKLLKKEIMIDFNGETKVDFDLYLLNIRYVY